MATFSELLDAGTFCSTSICVDCAMVVVNGDYPDDYDGNPCGNWPLARKHTLQRNRARYDVTLGHSHSGNYAETGCFHYGQPCEEDCDCDRTDFSRSRCALCETDLAGTRYDVILIDRAELN